VGLGPEVLEKLADMRFGEWIGHDCSSSFPVSDAVELEFKVLAASARQGVDTMIYTLPGTFVRWVQTQAKMEAIADALSVCPDVNWAPHVDGVEHPLRLDPIADRIVWRDSRDAYGRAWRAMTIVLDQLHGGNGRTPVLPEGVVAYRPYHYEHVIVTICFDMHMGLLGERLVTADVCIASRLRPEMTQPIDDVRFPGVVRRCYRLQLSLDNDQLYGRLYPIYKGVGIMADLRSGALTFPFDAPVTGMFSIICDSDAYAVRILPVGAVMGHDHYRHDYPYYPVSASWQMAIHMASDYIRSTFVTSATPIGPLRLRGRSRCRHRKDGDRARRAELRREYMAASLSYTRASRLLNCIFEIYHDAAMDLVRVRLRNQPLSGRFRQHSFVLHEILYLQEPARPVIVQNGVRAAERAMVRLLVRTYAIRRLRGKVYGVRPRPGMANPADGNLLLPATGEPIRLEQ